MNGKKNTGRVLVFIAAAVTAFGAARQVGLVSAQNGLTLNGAHAATGSTVFEGASVEVKDYSRLLLDSGTRMDLGGGSRATIYSSSASLESGMTEIQGGKSFELNANSLKVRLSDPNASARVGIDRQKGVLVTALNAPVDVLNRQGMLIARVTPGLPMTFLAQAGSPAGFDSTGCVVQKGGAAIIVDPNGNQMYELRGMDLRKAIGSTVHVIGTVDTTATPAGGASQVIKTTKATITKKGGCASVATKVGATTAAAGLGAAAGVGAAAGGAAAVGVGVGAAAAGIAGLSTTALVVGGVAAATAVGLGAAAATGALGSSSP